MKHTQTEDITDLLTEEGIKNLKKGTLIRFDFEGSITELIITSKRNGKVRAKHTTTYLPEDIVMTDSEGNKKALSEVGIDK